MEGVPEIKWICPRCTARGVKPSVVHGRGVIVKPLKHREKADILFPGKETRGQDSVGGTGRLPHLHPGQREAACGDMGHPAVLRSAVSSQVLHGALR